jgi:uncharacterized protein involved in outer membrane biogenesis
LRRLIVITSVLLVLLAVGLALVPLLFTWDDYRAQVTAKAEAMTGQTVAIDGRIDLNLLPKPTLSLARTTLSSGPDATERVRLEVDRLDLALKPLPLLGGRLDVEEIRLVRPVLQVEAAADRPELPQLVGAVAWLPLTANGPSRIRVIDGRVVLSDLALGGIRELDQVNLDLSTSDSGSAIVLDGTFASNRQPFHVDARLGRLTDEGSSTLRLELVADDEARPGASTVAFGGVVWWRSEAPELRGELDITGDDARSAIGRLGAALGDDVVPMPAWLAAPFRLGGPVALQDHRLELSRLEVGLNGAELSGRLALTLTEQPEINLALEAARLALPAEIASADAFAEVAALGARAARMRGQIDLSVRTLEHRGEELRRLRASLQLSGDGAATVRDARAILPGQTDISFSGRLEDIADDPKLRGKIAAVTRNLRGALAWLDLSPEGVAEERLNSLSLASQVSIARTAWRFEGIELRVDASAATGAVTVDLTARPRVAATIELDRLDIDAYWPDEPATAVLARLAQPFQAADAAIDARLPRLTWAGIQLLDVTFVGQAVDRHLTIDRLTVGDFAEAEAQVAGEVDLAAGRFDLAAEAQGVQVARLLRRLGVEPAPLLTRLQPLSLSGGASGSVEAARVDLELTDDAGKIALAGEIGLVEQRPHYRLEVAAEHPDYHSLLSDLGAYGHGGGGSAAPLAIAGRLEHDLSGATLVAGTARLGVTSFTGRVAWQDSQSRPVVTARISVGEPTAPVLAALLELSGLRLEWPSPGGVRGRWSEQPLAVDLIDRFDGEVTLSGKGGLAGPGFELSGRFDQGKLMLDQLATMLWGGQLTGELTMDARRPLPYLTAALDLSAFDPGAFAAWLGVAPVVSGQADLHLEATAAGHTVRDLVGSLIGDIEITAHEDTELRSLPPGFPVASTSAASGAATVELEGVTATLPLERGAVVVPPLLLAVDGTEVRLEGAIDLYLWAIDLTLRPRADRSLRLVGPLDRPQIRLQAEAPGAEPDEASP